MVGKCKQCGYQAGFFNLQGGLCKQCRKISGSSSSDNDYLSPNHNRGFFFKKVLKWSINEQRKEIASFVEILKGLDGAELGHIVALATDIRHRLELEGHIIIDPIVYLITNPEFTVTLIHVYQELQKHNKMQEASGVMVWIHTFRAAANLELRGLGRSIWRELERGFPHIDSSADGYYMLTNIKLDIEGANSFPKGLTPEPL